MDTKEIFLPHLSNYSRREIAVRFIQHEFRKLLPALRDASLWQMIDSEIRKWYEELSMRNFWNGVHGISMGFRLKSIVPWITSLNVQWTEKDVPIEELWFGGKFDSVVPQAGSESVSDVKEWVYRLENKDILEQIQKNQEERSIQTAPRDDFPIFVVLKDGKLRIIDGNRRVLRVLLANGENSIRAAVGEPTAKPVFYEHWVPTQLLVDLVFWYKRQAELGWETTDATAKVIAELIRDSSAGRIEFAECSIHRDDELHMRLLRAVDGVLATYDIHLEI